MNFIKDLLALFAIITTAIVSVVAAVVLAVLPIDYYGCEKYSEETGRTTKYVAGSCYVQVGSDWYTGPEYKAILIGGLNHDN